MMGWAPPRFPIRVASLLKKIEIGDTPSPQKTCAASNARPVLNALNSLSPSALMLISASVYRLPANVGVFKSSLAT